MSLVRAGAALQRPAIRSITGFGSLMATNAKSCSKALPRSWFLVSQIVRPFSITSRLHYDEFVKKKSEYRMPGLSDSRVRERHALVLPMAFLGILFVINSFLFFTTIDH